MSGSAQTADPTPTVRSPSFQVRTASLASKAARPKQTMTVRKNPGPRERLSLPIPTHTVLSTPVCGFETSRARYMKRQITPAPTNEMAIGMKIKDFARDSHLARSASTAIASPAAEAMTVTVKTHHRLLNTVPRNTEKAANATRTAPTAVAPARAG